MNERIKRQREVSLEGQKAEEAVVNLIINSLPEAKQNLLVDLCKRLPKNIKNRIKQLLLIPYGEEFSEEIDADVCVVCKRNLKLLAVISVKKSFRERGAQAAYWAVKVKQEKKPFHYILATPDVDKELFNPKNPNPEKKRKWRVILPYEFEAVFIFGYEGKVFKDKNFFVGNTYLKEWIKDLINAEC